jgi:hypothetical protein
MLLDKSEKYTRHTKIFFLRVRKCYYRVAEILQIRQ